jgi:Domain of unknown function (DUF4410)
MKKFVVSCLMVCASLMAGCGTTAKIQTEYKLPQGEKLAFKVDAPQDMSAEALGILNARLTAQLTSSGLLATPADAKARSLDVKVNNYYMRHGATRALFGIMAGADNIQSTIKITDKATGSVLSEFSVESKNASAWGTSSGMLEDHADKIINTLKGSKN